MDAREGEDDVSGCGDLSPTVSTFLFTAEERSGDRGQEHCQQSLVFLRTILNKRKLEELELGARDSLGSGVPHVRPRREPREEMQEDVRLKYLSDCVMNVQLDRISSEPAANVQCKPMEDADPVNVQLSLNEYIEDGKPVSMEEVELLSDQQAELTINMQPNALAKEDIERLDVLDVSNGDLLMHESFRFSCPQEEDCDQNSESFSNRHVLSGDCSDTSASFVGMSSALPSQGIGIPCCRTLEALNETSQTKVQFSQTKVQFFVRTFLDGRTIVLHANTDDTVESIHRQIFLRTGLPVSEQRLIYFGRQLQQDQTLKECQVCNDATLHLVARMLSTPLHKSWQVVSDLVATLHLALAMRVDAGTLETLQDKIRILVKEFLNMAAVSLPVSDHIQIFQLAGAPSALVIQLLSPVESNQDCAEEAIRLFLAATDDLLPADIHYYCAPVLLDFCKLLARSAPSHSLYPTCRNALAMISDFIGVAHSSTYFNGAKAETIVHDFAPFLDELASGLASTLRTTATTLCNVPLIPCLSAREAHDFAAFVTPLCKAMEACRNTEASCTSQHSTSSFCASFHCWEEANSRVLGALRRKDFTGNDVEGMLDEVDKKGGEIGSYTWLYTVFQGLLFEIDCCLERIEGEMLMPRDLPFGLNSVLVVLKGLHTIAELYEGCMETLLTILSSRCRALNGLIQQSGWQNDHFWLLEHKFLLEFESIKRVVLGMLPEPQDDFEERQEISVHRDQLLSDSFCKFEEARLDTLQVGLTVEFAAEEGTGPGVLREWFCLICREIFNPQNALFLSCPDDCRRFYPNPASGVNPEHLSYFRFCGRVIALAFMHRVQIDVVFTSIFYKQVAGLPITWEDVKDADPVLYGSCKKILEMDAELVDSDVLGLTFVHEFEELGVLKTVELCAGGTDMQVNSLNRSLYVELLVRSCFVTSTEEQVKYFSQGFSDLLVSGSVQQFLQALDPQEFELMLFGKDRNICIDDWKKHTEYHEYSSSDCQMIWFWEVVSNMTMEQRRRLLFFSTSVNHLPVEGFAGLSSKFHIRKAHTDATWLPTAHTCFYQLILPQYPSYEIMHEKLLAVVKDHLFEGFGFS